jgi:hypothetical protein
LTRLEGSNAVGRNIDPDGKSRVLTLRDWVIRFNEQGPDGLVNIPSPGALAPDAATASAADSILGQIESDPTITSGRQQPLETKPNCRQAAP